MASTKADRNAVAWTYTDEASQDWRVSARGVYVLDVTDGAKYGGSAAAGSVRGKPVGLKMRAVYCVSPAGKTALIPAYDTACDLWTTPGTTVTRDLNGVDIVFTSTADKRAEKAGRQCKQAA
jgi:hypothetical protein